MEREIKMKKEMIGLNTYLYTYGLRDKDNYHKAMARLSKTGKVTELFVNNKLAFEWKKYRKVY